jgi:hypothetical protein
VVTGAVLIACGIGLLWTARTYAEVRADVQAGMRAAWRRRHPNRPLLGRLLIPPAWPKADAWFGYVMGVVAIVGGVLAVLGVWG